MTTIEDPFTSDVAPVNRDAFAPSTEWQNFGDANPERHGGIFVKWQETRGAWQVVRTISAESLPEDVTEDEQMVQKLELYPDDIWEDPEEPETEFTDAGQWSVDQHISNYYPNTMPTLDSATRLFIPTMVAYQDYNRRTSFESGDYADIIESHGVDTDELDHY